MENDFYSDSSSLVNIAGLFIHIHNHHCLCHCVVFSSEKKKEKRKERLIVSQDTEWRVKLVLSPSSTQSGPCSTGPLFEMGALVESESVPLRAGDQLQSCCHWFIHFSSPPMRSLYFFPKPIQLVPKHCFLPISLFPSLE